MVKLTTTDLTQLSTNETSAVTEINANNALIETAMENTLSRDGTTPNTMSADFDLNSNDLLNGGVGNFSSVVVNGVAVSSSAGTIGFQEEGSAVVTSGTLNVVGSSATLTDVGGIATLTISGSGGGATPDYSVDLTSHGSATFIVDLVDDLPSLSAGDVLEVYLIDIDPTSDFSDFYVEVSDDDQVSWESTNYNGWVNAEYSAGTNKVVSTARMDIVNPTAGWDLQPGLGEHYNGRLEFYGLKDAVVTHMIGEGMAGDTGISPVAESARSAWLVGNVVTDLRFTCGSNFVGGQALFFIRSMS